MHAVPGALGLITFGSWFACTPSATDPLSDLFAGGSGEGVTSVNDVTEGDVGSPTGGPLGGLSEVRARVRNESSARADVTLRFIRGSSVVHLAFVRVLPDSITTVTSPETVESVELSGVDDRGRALESATYRFGVDFSATAPANYTVRDPVESPRPAPEDPPSPGPVRLVFLEPTGDVRVVLGGVLTARWADESSSAGLVTVFLKSTGAGGRGDLFAMGPAIGAALDGINDQLEFIVQGVGPGGYQLVGRLDDGSRTVTAVASGRIEVVRDPEDVAPTLQLLGSPTPPVVSNGGSFSISWVDEDPDDNATITFELATPGSGDAANGRVALGPPIAEDPDGPTADTATFVIRGVLPGVYDLLATIDDGKLLGSVRLEQAVRLLPDRENDPPRLQLLEPSADLVVEVGGAFRVRWDDDDANDNARISLLLDPDLGNDPLDGDELLLVASLGEDADGVGDQITLGVASDAPLGRYRLVGLISDGLTESMTRAPGLVEFKRAADSSDNTNGNSNDNTNANTNGNSNDNGNDNTQGGGGGIIIIQPPPDLPAPWTVTPIDVPIGDLVVLQGEVVTVVVGPGIRFDSSRSYTRAYVSNLRFGGEVRVDASPPGFPLEGFDSPDATVQIRTDAVPNAAWPRKFDIEVETLLDGVFEIARGPQPIWILQDVEVVAASPGGSDCISLDDAAAGEGSTLEFQWYGGGVEENGPHPPVEFWLSADGEVPEDGTQDLDHLLIAEVAASPNRVQTTVVDVAALLAGTIVGDSPDGGLPNVTPGEYFLIPSLPLRSPSPLAAPAFPEAIRVCGPASTDGG